MTETDDIIDWSQFAASDDLTEREPWSGVCICGHPDTSHVLLTYYNESSDAWACFGNNPPKQLPPVEHPECNCEVFKARHAQVATG